MLARVEKQLSMAALFTGRKHHISVCCAKSITGSACAVVHDRESHGGSHPWPHFSQNKASPIVARRRNPMNAQPNLGMQVTTFENPMGINGFEFVEFAAPAGRANELHALFRQMGFSAVLKH